MCHVDTGIQGKPEAWVLNDSDVYAGVSNATDLAQVIYSDHDTLSGCGSERTVDIFGFVICHSFVYSDWPPASAETLHW